MKNLLICIPLILFLKCGSNSAPKYTLKVDTPKKQLTVGDSINLRIALKKNQTIDSVHFFWDQQPTSEHIKVKNQKLGTHLIKAVVFKDGNQTTTEKEVQLFASNPPELYTYKILNEFPHDTEAYTQGLEFSGGKLFESTGLRGQSTLRVVDYTTGEIENKIALDKVYFGEGLTLLEDKIYQLTWQEDLAFIYAKNTLETLGSFAYQNSKEGWGLCNDGHYLYKSDGTNAIWKLDPQSGKELEKIEVMTNKSALNKLNELEWIDGKIYANTYQFNKEVAVIINPEDGTVEGVIDFSGLKEKVAQIPTLNVLNGMAFHPTRKTLFVTGKNWSKLFEVALIKK